MLKLLPPDRHILLCLISTKNNGSKLKHAAINTEVVVYIMVATSPGHAGVAIMLSVPVHINWIIKFCTFEQNVIPVLIDVNSEHLISA